MKNIIKSLAVIGLLAGMFVQNKLAAQALVGPAPFCMPLYGAWATPCNQGGASNAPGNWINDFINSFSTAGAVTNITNNNSGCNAQNFPNVGQRNYFNHGCQNYLVVNPGQNIVCTLQSGNVYGQGFAIFIDWNNNGVFNLPAERVAWTPNVPPAASFVNINFTVPAAQPAGAYRMRVRCVWAMNGTNMDPCIQYSYGETEDYTVYVGMTPTGVITATASSNGPICNGSALNLNVLSSASPTTPLSYTWTGPAAFTSTLQAPTIANAQPNMSGVYTVTVDPGACPVTKTVMVNVYPTPTINIMANNGPICQNNQLDIGSTSQTSASVTYSWTGPNGFTANTPSASIPNAQPNASGFYTLVVTNSYLAPTYNPTLSCTTIRCCTNGICRKC